MLETTRSGCLGHEWDLTLVFVASKGNKYSLAHYHFLDTMLTMSLTPPFFIDDIEMQWEHDDALHVDRFFSYLCCCLALVDAPEFRSCIVYFPVWWTEPMPFYHHFFMFVIEIIILFESPSLPVDNEKSFVRSESSSDDSKLLSLFWFLHNRCYQALRTTF